MEKEFQEGAEVGAGSNILEALDILNRLKLSRCIGDSCLSNMIVWYSSYRPMHYLRRCSMLALRDIHCPTDRWSLPRCDTTLQVARYLSTLYE